MTPVVGVELLRLCQESDSDEYDEGAALWRLSDGQKMQFLWKKDGDKTNCNFEIVVSSHVTESTDVEGQDEP